MMHTERTIGNDYGNDDIAVYASCNYSNLEGHVWVDILRATLDSDHPNIVGIKLTIAEAKALAARLMEVAEHELPAFVVQCQSGEE